MSGKSVVLLCRQATPPPSAPVLCPYLLSYGKKLVKERGMTAEDATQISLSLCELRARSGRCGHGVSVYVAFWGYGDVKSRNTLLRGMRYALRPRVIFASHKKNRAHDPAAPRGAYFEGVVFFQPNVASLDELETLFERYHMSVGTTDLDTHMSEAMVTCLGRVRDGEYAYGNWDAAQNIVYREHYERFRRSNEDREARQNVFTVTGMHTSNSNMLALYYSSQNMHIELQQTHMQMQVMMAMAEEVDAIVADALAVATSVEGTNGTLLRDSLNALLDGNARMRAHMRIVIHSTRPPPYALPAQAVAPAAPVTPA